MADDSDSYGPDHERVQESAVDRRQERTETVKDVLGDVGGMLEEKISSDDRGTGYRVR